MLPFWSRILKLTMHEKTDIDPRSHDPAKLPVSDIDLALAEGVCRRLSNALLVMLGSEDKIAALEADQATEDQREKAQESVEEHRDLLKRLVLGMTVVGPITGSVERDMGVVTELGTRTWDRILNPAASDDVAERPEAIEA